MPVAEQTVRRDQADAAADRRQRRTAAAGGQRQRVDAAARTRLEPAPRARGPDGARRHPTRLLSLAVAECLVFAFSAASRAVFSAAGRCAPSCRCLPARCRRRSDRHRRRAALFTLAVISPVLGVALRHRRRAAPAASAGRRCAEEVIGRTDRRIGRATRTALVVAQVALAVVLLSAAGLMLNSVVEALARASWIRRRSSADVQDRADGVELCGGRGARRVHIGPACATQDDRGRSRRRRSRRQIPFGGTRGANGVEVEGRPRVAGRASSIIVDQRHVSPDYFQTMGVPMVQWAWIPTNADDSRAESVVVINRTMAERLLAECEPDRSPCASDRRLRLGRLVPHRRRRRRRAARLAEPRSGAGDVRPYSRRRRCRPSLSWSGPSATRRR